MLLDAIVALGFQRMNLDDTHEQASVVICNAAEYCFITDPIRSQEGQFRIRIGLRPGEYIAAIMHTHPSTGVAWDQSEQFSQDDKDMARHLHVPSYVYVVKLHKTIVFNP